MTYYVKNTENRQQELWNHISMWPFVSSGSVAEFPRFWPPQPLVRKSDDDSFVQLVSASMFSGPPQEAETAADLRFSAAAASVSPSSACPLVFTTVGCSSEVTTSVVWEFPSNSPRGRVSSYDGGIGTREVSAGCAVSAGWQASVMTLSVIALLSTVHKQQTTVLTVV